MKNFLLFFIFIPVLSIAQNPSFEWVRGIEIPGANLSFSSIEDVTVDQQGNVISTGYFRGNFVDFYGEPASQESAYLNSANVQSGFVQKMDANGSFLWANKIGSGSVVKVYSIDVDSEGSIYCAGYFLGTNDFDSGSGITELTAVDGADAFILKLNSDGTFAWVKQIECSGSVVIFSLVLDDLENITLSGIFQGTADFDPASDVSELASISYSDIFIAKLNDNGDFVWAKQIGSITANSGHEEEVEHTVDSNGDIILTGWFYNTLDFDPGPEEFNLTSSNGEDLFVLKLSSEGEFEWANQVSASFSGTVIGEGIDVDDANNLYITGRFTSYVDFDSGPGETEIFGGNGDAFILKLGSNGDFVWAREIDGIREIRGSGIVVATDGTSYSTGGFIDTPDFDSGPNTFTLSSGSTSSEDAYILKLDADGNFLWAGDMGSVQEDFGTTIYLDNNDNIISIGTYIDPGDTYPELDFDPGPGVHTIASNATNPAGLFILKLNQDGLPLQTKSNEQDLIFNVYPNPSQGNVTVQLKNLTGYISLSVFDITGRIVQHKTMNYQPVINLQLPEQNGLYLIDIKDLENNSYKTVVSRK